MSQIHYFENYISIPTGVRSSTRIQTSLRVPRPIQISQTSILLGIVSYCLHSILNMLLIQSSYCIQLELTSQDRDLCHKKPNRLFSPLNKPSRETQHIVFLVIISPYIFMLRGKKNCFRYEHRFTKNGPLLNMSQFCPHSVLPTQSCYSDCSFLHVGLKHLSDYSCFPHRHGTLADTITF